MPVNRFSPHPSNPLEVGSSDVTNRSYRARIQEQDALLSTTTSDDPMDMIPKYQSHLAEVVQGYEAPQAMMQEQDQEFVELESSDDLQVMGQDDTPRKAIAAKEDYDEHMSSEEEEEAVRVTGDVTRIFDDDAEHDEEEEEDVGPGLGGEDDEDEEMRYEYDEDEDDEDDYNDVYQPTSDDLDCFALDESEEEASIKQRPMDEQNEIQQEMQDFKRSLPALEGNYKLIDRLGTGTFSSVYKAIDLQYDTYDNSPWLGHHPSDSSAHWQSVAKPPGSRVFVAIKRIYVTSGPERIKNELLIMETCRGCRHVSQLITAFRHEDQVAIVMPYQRNDDFRDYFTELPMAGIKEYFRCLLRALRDIHRRQIIHRDVKPANFLFDPRTGQGSLCDFGLAQRFDSKTPTYGGCLHTTGREDYPHGKYIRKTEYDTDAVKKAQGHARFWSRQRPENVGYPDKEIRPPMKANRAGTRGFRAPEVLFKCGQQNGAVDVWSAGIILLFFLTRKFPLFQSNDDVEALMEIAAILGKSKMEKVATLHCRTFTTNVPDAMGKETTWRDFTENLNPDLHTMPPPNPKFYPYTLPSQKKKLVLEAEARNALADPEADASSKSKPTSSRSRPAKSDPEHKPKSIVDKENAVPGYSSTAERLREQRQRRREEALSARRSSMPVDPIPPPPAPPAEPPLTIDLRNGNPLLGDCPGSPLTPISSPPLPATDPQIPIDEPLSLDDDNNSETVLVGATPEPEAAPGPPLPPPPPPGPTPEEVYKKDVENALDLLHQLLHPESVWRITPKEALDHPFLSERIPPAALRTTAAMASSSSESAGAHHEFSDSTLVMSTGTSADAGAVTVSGDNARVGPPPKKLDDDYVPHPFGEGVCKKYHFVDSSTEMPGVILRVRKCVCGCGQPGCEADGSGERGWEEVRRLVSAGEGITIGRNPCEYHKDMEFW